MQIQKAKSGFEISDTAYFSTFIWNFSTKHFTVVNYKFGVQTNYDKENQEYKILRI